MKQQPSRPPSETQPLPLRPKSGSQSVRRTPSVKSPAKKTQGGFTLLEIMMVVIIIGLLVGSAVKFMGGNIGVAQDVRVKADIQAFSTQLKVYQALNGFLPSTEQGLKALVTQPSSEPRPRQWRQFFDKMPLDPWQNEYNYSAPGTHNPNSFDLFSSGQDRKVGTADDIGNWDK